MKATGTVDPATLAVYEEAAERWQAARPAESLDRAAGLAEAAGSPDRDHDRGAPVVLDLGCGPGIHLRALGPGAIGLDASPAMLRLARRAAPEVPLVVADLGALPFRPGRVAGAWASKSYVHLPRSAVPLALAELHRSLPVGAAAEIVVFGGDTEFGPHPLDDFAGRNFSSWPGTTFLEILAGAGFVVVELRLTAGTVNQMRVVARRAESLPDTVGPDMSVLVCGLNPSPASAASGIGFARPGNLFWPAALRAGLVGRDREPLHALAHHGLGMTDIVKRTTAKAAELRPVEYRTGMVRLTRLVRWLQPSAVCFVGLAGYRAAADRSAVAGVQDAKVGGAPTYVMPSTSGLNAHSSLEQLTEHLAAVKALAERHGSAGLGPLA